MKKVTQEQLSSATSALSEALEAYAARSPRDDVDEHVDRLTRLSASLQLIRRRKMPLDIDHNLVETGVLYRLNASRIIAEEAALKDASESLGFTLREQGVNDFPVVHLSALRQALRAAFRAGTVPLDPLPQNPTTKNGMSTIREMSRIDQAALDSMRRRRTSELGPEGESIVFNLVDWLEGKEGTLSVDISGRRFCVVDATAPRVPGGRND